MSSRPRRVSPSTGRSSCSRTIRDRLSYETPKLHLAQVAVVEAPGVVHLTYRRVSDT